MSQVSKWIPRLGLLTAGVFSVLLIQGYSSPNETAELTLSVPVPGARVSSNFGSRLDPLYQVERYHTGIDYAAEIGTPVLAAGDGIVEMATEEYPVDPSRGTVVIIRHGDLYSTLYAHLGSISVEKGQEIKAGDQIGTIGTTGRTSGAHLHFEVHEVKDPNLFLR